MTTTVVYDYQAFLLQEYGGISRYFYELATRISNKDGFAAKIIAPAHINHYLRGVSDSLLVGQPIPSFYQTQRFRTAINRGLSRLALRQWQPDLVHETYYSPRRLAPPRSKLVVTVHDMIHEKFKATFLANDPTSAYKAKTVARADHIICVSENTRRDLLEWFDVDPANVSVTYLGCSLQPVVPVAIDAPKPPRPYLLYIGYRPFYKNFGGFLIAYAMSKTLRRDFDVICFGGSPFSTAELKQFSTYGLTSTQIRHVQGDDTVLANLYTNAAVFVYPSLYEGFGIPPLEAMICKCPVACSDRSSIPEVVGDAAELFDPSDPESIVSALERVVYSRDRAQTLVQRGVERVKQFTWENCVEQTCAIYNSLL